MRQNRNGVIINIGSMAGKIVLSPLGPYSASKFALEAITEALAQELKRYNIRVYLVEPGIINTEMAFDITGIFGANHSKPQYLPHWLLTKF